MAATGESLGAEFALSQLLVMVSIRSPSAKAAFIANRKRDRVIWESCAKDASAYIVAERAMPAYRKANWRCA